MVAENESLFSYFSNSYDDYNFPAYRPNFDFTMENAPAEARSVCGDDWACLFDFSTTGDATIANQTLALGDQYSETRNLSQQTITQCPRIEFDNGYCYLKPNLIPPATANCSCLLGYRLVGNSFFSCTLDTLVWNGTLPTCESVVTDSTTLTVPTTSKIAAKMFKHMLIVLSFSLVLF